jgi:polyisoprenyl-teichoic acid--peptidoglycan teichoic acid transferase
MGTTHDNWGRLNRAQRLFAVGLPIVIATAMVSGLVLVTSHVGPVVAEVLPSPTPTRAPALPPIPMPSPPAFPSLTPTPTPVPPSDDQILGTDGRLTVLLLGSDYRPAHPGNRTDAIMVVSIDPVTGRTAALSVPRDTSQFPLPKKGTFSAKVNGLYAYLEGRGNGLTLMRAAVSRAFDIEIDGTVFIGFAGVKQLVNAVGGVDVTLASAYYDRYYWVTPRKRGWGLPKGTSHLNGANALIFARSRKGDNDFGRARRQQLLVMAALEEVRDRGPAILPKLLGIAKSTIRTDLPLEKALAMFEIISTANLKASKRVVFGPRTYARSTGGSSFALLLGTCRAWVRRNFPPERPKAAWPPRPSPEPSPPAVASPPASASPGTGSTY